MIELSEEQRETLKEVLKDMGLNGQEEIVEKAMLGQLSPIEVLELIRGVSRISWLRGQQATVELHNKILMRRDK